MIQTVADNLKLYTKREVMSARFARELIARMGYPSVEKAISMLRTGCTRTDQVTRKMEFKDSSILSIVLNIDTSYLLTELSHHGT